MIDTAALKRDWLAQPRADILAGIVVALALIPEAIGFSIIAGVDPRVGLYASIAIAMVIAFTGGRPGMISAATAAVAVVVVPLVRDHGVEYLFAATILMGIFQGIAALLRLDLLMQFVSRSVITGFVNALAILIFMAQLPQLEPRNDGVSWLTYAMVAGGPGDHLPAAAPDHGRPLPAGGDHRAGRAVDRAGLRCQHRRRHGRAARRPALFHPARRAADVGNLADHRPLFADDGGGRPARNRC